MTLEQYEKAERELKHASIYIEHLDYFKSNNVSEEYTLIIKEAQDKIIKLMEDKIKAI